MDSLSRRGPLLSDDAARGFGRRRSARTTYPASLSLPLAKTSARAVVPAHRAPFLSALIATRGSARIPRVRDVRSPWLSPPGEVVMLAGRAPRRSLCRLPRKARRLHVEAWSRSGLTGPPYAAQRGMRNSLVCAARAGRDAQAPGRHAPPKPWAASTPEGTQPQPPWRTATLRHASPAR